MGRRGANLPPVTEGATDDDVLHELRIRGTAADEGEVADRLVDAGFAVRRREVLMLTPAGRVEAGARFRLRGAEKEAVQATYDRFLPLNRSLLQICTDWQLRPGNVPNDHSDKAYD